MKTQQDIFCVVAVLPFLTAHSDAETVWFWQHKLHKAKI